MSFTNAAKGVKKIFTAEVLKLIANICLIIAAVIGLVGLVMTLEADADFSSVESLLSDIPAASIGAFLGAIGMALIYGILSVIAFILNLIGYINARHDDDNFTTALVFLIAGIVFYFASFFVLANGLSSILYSLGTLSDTLAKIFVIAGCMKIATRLDRADINKKGSNVLKLIITIEAITFVITFISTFLRGTATAIFGSVLMLASFVLSFVMFIMYISFLSKTKKMLQENE